ncbi:olfactory receptor 13A1-like [Dasypus novemcinctus]|uniref:olfactory receptor 13A1-like n=1 Tax=Dasypus novemcinctus TaxID=9361 RepID=UPI00265FDE17|nr:olfactory receptor 13A1-like [Dasypus novemcinctus]
MEFVLQSLSENPQLQGVFSAVFFLLFLMAFAGNSLILMAICLNPALHTPMYFFLSNLAILDLICTFTVLPKLLENLVGKSSTITYEGCMTQLFFLSWILVNELLLLTVMAYDRYVAISQPLHYQTLLSRALCALLAGIVWAVGGVNASVHTGLMTQLNYCGQNQIPHFVCEVPTLLLLACSSTQLNNIIILIEDIFFGLVNFLFTVASYAFIISCILCIRSAEGKRRAFFTCSSHLLVVCMYYSTVIYTYLLPGFGSSAENGKVVSILYTAVSPTLNPLIYTLRNKDVKKALRRVFSTFVK